MFRKFSGVKKFFRKISFKFLKWLFFWWSTSFTYKRSSRSSNETRYFPLIHSFSFLHFKRIVLKLRWPISVRSTDVFIQSSWERYFCGSNNSLNLVWTSLTKKGGRRGLLFWARSLGDPEIEILIKLKWLCHPSLSGWSMNKFHYGLRFPFASSHSEERMRPRFDLVSAIYLQQMKSQPKGNEVISSKYEGLAK